MREFNDEQNKKAKKTLDQAGVIRDEPLTGTNYLDPACQRQRRNHAFSDHPRQAGGVVAGHADFIRLVSGSGREMSARYGVGCMHNVMTGREKQKFVRLVSIGVRFEVLVGVKIHSDDYVISLISRSLYVKCAGPILDL